MAKTTFQMTKDLERERKREERERRELAKLLKSSLRRQKQVKQTVMSKKKKKGKKGKKKVGEEDKDVKVVQILGYTLRVPKGTKTDFSIKVKFDNKVVRIGQRGVRASKHGFAKVKVYRKVDLLHTLHALRIKTERELSNKIELLSLNNETEEQIREKLLRMHEVEKSKGRKAQKYAYFEVMSYFEDKRLVKKFMKMLEERFNTDVFAVLHYDENAPHAHIIVSWKNREGKAIRLGKSDFRKLWRQAIEIMQPSRRVSPRPGLGRSSLPFYQIRNAYLQSNEEWIKIIKKLRLETELYQRALEKIQKELDEEIDERGKRKFSMRKVFYEFLKATSASIMSYAGWMSSRFCNDFINFLKGKGYIALTFDDVMKEIKELLGYYPSPSISLEKPISPSISLEKPISEEVKEVHEKEVKTEKEVREVKQEEVDLQTQAKEEKKEKEDKETKKEVQKQEEVDLQYKYIKIQSTEEKTQPFKEEEIKAKEVKEEKKEEKEEKKEKEVKEEVVKYKYIKVQSTEEVKEKKEDKKEKKIISAVKVDQAYQKDQETKEEKKDPAVKATQVTQEVVKPQTQEVVKIAKEVQDLKKEEKEEIKAKEVKEEKKDLEVKPQEIKIEEHKAKEEIKQEEQQEIELKEFMKKIEELKKQIEEEELREKERKQKIEEKLLEKPSFNIHKRSKSKAKKLKK